MATTQCTHLELNEKVAGLNRLKSLTSTREDSPAKKTALVLIASRVGRALIDLRPALQNFEERQSELVQRYGEKDDKGQLKMDDTPNGPAVRLADFNGFNADRKALLAQEIDIPISRGITYADLAAAEVVPDGELVQQLGEFLQGEPSDYFNLSASGRAEVTQ